MFSFVLKKILSLFILFIFLVSIVLLLQKSRQGSAALVLSGQRSNEAEMEALKEKTGENLSVYEHVFKIMSDVALLDFGYSNSGQKVSSLVNESFAKTFVLAMAAGIFSLGFGISLGLAGHIFPPWRKYLQNINYGLMSIPIFVYALVLLWVFSIYFMIFPPGGVDKWTWFILPAATLGLKSGAQVYLFMDEFVSQETGKNYVKTGTAYGYKRGRLYRKFIFKNMALPLFSFWLLELGSYLSGAAIVEMIYSIPGIGSLLLKALLKYDINLLIGIFVWVAIIIFFIGILQEYLDRKYAGYMGNKNEA